MQNWQLVYTETGKPVQEGDTITYRHQVYTIAPGIGRPPHKLSSTGRIWVRDTETRNPVGSIEFFPGVFNARWIEIQ